MHIQHWDRCVEKVLRFENSSTWRELLLQIKMDFLEEIGGGAFRLYSLPKNCEEVNDRKRIRDIEQLNAFVASDISKFENSLDQDQLYIFNCNDESPTKLPENTKVIEDNRSEGSSRTYRSKAVARFCRMRDQNKCVFCDYTDSTNIQHCHFLGLAEFNGTKAGRERDALLLRLQISETNDGRNVICLCVNCHRQWDGHKIGVHPKKKTLLIVKAVGLELTQGGISYNELAGTTIQFGLDPPLTLLNYRYQFFKRMLDEEAANVQLASRKEKKSARPKAKKSARPKAK